MNMATPIETTNAPMGTVVMQSDSNQFPDGTVVSSANLIKPIVSSPANSQVLIVRKSSGISSLGPGTCHSLNQLITSTPESPKIVSVPVLGMQNCTKLLNSEHTTQLSMPKNPGVKVIWPQNLTSSLLPIKHNTANNSLQNVQPIAVKRTVAPSSGNQVFTKVIITSNPNQPSNQSVTPISISGNVSGTGSSSNVSQPLLLSSPTRTITLSRNFMNVPGTTQVVKTSSSTPTKQGVYLLSPVKAPQKVTTVQQSLIKSPRRIAPATSVFPSLVTSKLSTVPGSIVTTSATMTKTVTIHPTQSPKKLLVKTISGNLSSVLASTPITPSQVPSVGMVSQPLQIPGNNIHFVRLVSAPNSSTTNTTANKQASLLPITTSTSVVSSLPTITVTSQMCKGATITKQAVKIKPSQKLIIPAPTSSTQATTTLTNTQIGQQLASGTLIPLGNSGSGYVVVPANYVTQLQNSAQSSVSNTPMMIQNILPAPVLSTSNVPVSTISPTAIETTDNASSNFLTVASAQPTPTLNPVLATRYMNGRMPTAVTEPRPRKPCNCTKSQCLKLYCDCFASGEFCYGCNCNNCYNNLAHEEERQKAIKSCLDRNRMAFHPKIGKSREGDTERRHTKGCHCKRSGCLKNYCECYEAKILCTDLCKCIGCKNFEDSYERKTLMHLADAAEVRVQQQAAAITNFTSDIFDGLPRSKLNSRRNQTLPISFINDEVIEATVSCLLTRAHHAEKQRKSEGETEKLLLEELGLCLMSIITRANQAEDICSDVEVDSNS